MNTPNTSSASLVTLAPAIAAALPGQWVARPVSEDYHDSNFYLIRADGLTLFLAHSRGNWAPKGKLRVSHNRPRNGGQYVELYAGAPHYGKIESPDMNVAETKSAAQIAADIVRRLLPEAETVERLTREKIAATNDYETRKRATLERVSYAAEEPIAMRHGTNEPRFEGRAGEGVRFEICGPDEANFTVRTNEAQALALLAFLKSPAFAGLAPAKE